MNRRTKQAERRRRGQNGKHGEIGEPPSREGEYASERLVEAGMRGRLIILVGGLHQETQTCAKL